MLAAAISIVQGWQILSMFDNWTLIDMAIFQWINMIILLILSLLLLSQVLLLHLLLVLDLLMMLRTYLLLDVHVVFR